MKLDCNGCPRYHSRSYTTHNTQHFGYIFSLLQVCNNRCKTPLLLTTSEFTSYNTGQSYHLKSTVTCKTTNEVYLMQCKKCGQHHLVNGVTCKTTNVVYLIQRKKCGQQYVDETGTVTALQDKQSQSRHYP